jgi:hypothetical protein
VKIIVLIFLCGLQWALFNSAHASRNHITNNYYPMTIVEGVSDEELAEGLAGAASAGSHQFDFSYSGYQGSVTGAFIDSEDSVSFGLAKRFKKVDALIHGSYTRVLDNDHLWVIGTTFRF